MAHMERYAGPLGRACVVIESDGRWRGARARKDVGGPGGVGPGYDAFSSGLGLEGARRRVESLGGSLSVSQGEGRWTTILSVPFQAVP